MMKPISVWKQELSGGAHAARLAALYCCAPEQMQLLLYIFLFSAPFIFYLSFYLLLFIKCCYLLIHNIYLFLQLKYYDFQLLIFVRLQYKLYYHSLLLNLEYVKLLL